MAKLIAIFKAHPDRVRYRDIERILVCCGCEKIEAKGSHVVFKHRSLTTNIVIPVHNGECKEFYKRQAYKQLKDIL